MYCGVPRTMPSIVSPRSVSSARPRGDSTVAVARGAEKCVPFFNSPASPQSMTSTSPNSPTMTLSGFKSRWITPREWAKATASQTFRKISSSRSSAPSSVPLHTARMIALSVRPRTIFIV